MPTPWLTKLPRVGFCACLRGETLLTLFIAGGKAAAAVASAEDGEGIVKVALEKFGGVHILVANAGILRDKSFTAMTEKEWDDVIAVHLR